MILKFATAALALAGLACAQASAQTERWQQRVYYSMDIDFDATTHRFAGKQRLVYQNNSSDTLRRVFYHLYFNAFQPNSMMDVRSRTIIDPDPRVGERISRLREHEIGYQKILSLQQNGLPLTYKVSGTILEVTLAEALGPGANAVFDMEFEAQVPLQIRRSGRNSTEGIDYSMAQWYPKMCEYDYMGWHDNPYVGREFHGVWGDFDVRISIDKRYVIGATGYLQNAEEIGHGYTDQPVRHDAGIEKLTWHFLAPNVHDFVWGADPDYTHVRRVRDDGTTLHFFYVKNERTEANWEKLPAIMDRAFDFINPRYGQYPYRQYSFIQGGDGGMEYPMATLITGERNLTSLVGVSVHELMHSWYHGVLATNESLHAWMDEGFTSYVSNEVMNFLRGEGLIPGRKEQNPHLQTMNGYLNFALSGYEEPLSVHADHFTTNTAYGVGAYSKGATTLLQLQYIMGADVFDRALLAYYDQWRFRHPNPNDFFRVMEKVSDLHLRWFKEYWVYTTHTIDYAVESASPAAERGKTLVTLAKNGVMPMPIDLVVTYANGRTEVFHIPLRMMRGAKREDAWYPGQKIIVCEDWPWTNPEYTLLIDAPAEQIVKLEIDPTQRLADINRENNVFSPRR